jgi:hypothetical protein
MPHEADVHEPAKASHREWFGLRTATVLSIVLHLCLAAGLTKTGLGILSLPTPDAPADAHTIFRPKPARDFPLEVSRSESDAAAHEKPLDLPLATGRVGRRPEPDRSPTMSRPSPAPQADDLTPRARLPEQTRQAPDSRPAPPRSPRRIEPTTPDFQADTAVPTLTVKAEAASATEPTAPQRRSPRDARPDRSAAVAPRFPREVAVLSRAAAVPTPTLRQTDQVSVAAITRPAPSLARRVSESAAAVETDIVATPLPVGQPSPDAVAPQPQVQPRSAMLARVPATATTLSDSARMSEAPHGDSSPTSASPSSAAPIAAMSRRQHDMPAAAEPSVGEPAASLPRSDVDARGIAATGGTDSAAVAPLTAIAGGGTRGDGGPRGDGPETSSTGENTSADAGTPQLAAPSFARTSAAGRSRAGISAATNGEFHGADGGSTAMAMEEGLSTDGMALTDGSLAAMAQTRRSEGTGNAALPEATALPRSSAIVLPVETRAREIAMPFRKRMARNRLPHDADELVDRGLDFLERAQQKDGRWQLQTYPGAQGEPAPKLASDTAATGLALLSFLGAGHDHFSGEHADTVRRGLEFLISIQKEDGDLYLPADPLSNSCAWMYSQGIATTALCEAVGMTGDDHLRPAATRACGFIAASQHPTRKGWRYTPRSDADLSVSGWMLIALRSGELAGVPVAPQALSGVRELLDAATIPPAAGRGTLARFHYNEAQPEQRPSAISLACMNALGTLMRLHTGWRPEDEAVQENSRSLAAILPAYAVSGQITRDCYLWYYASQVLVHTGGDPWDRWYAALVDVLRDRQEQDGPLAGSWPPMGPVPDRWGRYGGRIYVTTLQLLTLEVPSRHLPTYSFNDASP